MRIKGESRNDPKASRRYCPGIHCLRSTDEDYRRRVRYLAHWSGLDCVVDCGHSRARMVALEESISKAFAMKTMAPTLLRQNFRTRRKHWVCHAESNAGRHVGGCRRLPNVANGHVY